MKYNIKELLNGIDTRMDKRYLQKEDVVLVCEKCGALFKTINLGVIGDRDIKTFCVDIDSYYTSIYNEKLCLNMFHTQDDLRLLNEGELRVLVNEADKDLINKIIRFNTMLKEKGLLEKYLDKYFSLFDMNVNEIEGKINDYIIQIRELNRLNINTSE